MTRVLLIEKSVSFNIAPRLERIGMSCDVLAIADELETCELDYDVMVWDLALGGIEMIRRLRAACHRLPIIVLCGNDSFKLRIQVLDAGADAVLQMPFMVDELASMIRAVTRRHFGMTNNIVTCGRITINLDHHEVLVDGLPVAEPLSRNQFAILAILAQHKGKLLSKQQIIGHLYRDDGEPTVGLKIIDVYLAAVRRKIPELRDYLRTQHGVGHRLDDSPTAVRLAQRLSLAA